MPKIYENGITKDSETGQIYQVGRSADAVDGSQLTNLPINATVGSFTKNAADASATTTTIAHGLGRVPLCVQLFSEYVGRTSGVFYDGTTNSGNYSSADGGSGLSASLLLLYTGGDQQSGVVSFDETNIYIEWTKTGSPTQSAYIIWMAR